MVHGIWLKLVEITSFERYLSMLSENHKCSEIGLTEVKLWCSGAIVYIIP